METFRHVIQYYNQYTFKLTINGERVLPGAWWATRGQTSFYAELSKWYYRERYRLSHHTVRMSPHVTQAEFDAHAVSLGIDLSDLASVFQNLPKGVKEHIKAHEGELEDFAALNVNVDFKRATSSVLSHLRSVVSDLRQAVSKTSGAQKDFLELAIGVFEKYSNDFQCNAVKAAKEVSK